MKVELDTLPWQLEFIESQDKLALVMGGVGCGKSIICGDWLIERAIEYPHGQHYIIGANYPTLKEGTIPTFESRLDAHGFKYKLNRTDLSITIDSGPAKGCRIVSWTAEKYATLKGILLDSVWADEMQVWQRGWDAYTFIVNRNRMSEAAQAHHPSLQPRIRMSANPPRQGSSHWLVSKLIGDGIGGEDDHRKYKPRVFRPNIFENWLLPGREEYIEMLRETYDADLFRLEVLGEVVDLKGGRVYYNFDRAMHVKSEVGGLPVTYDPRYPLVWSHDWGYTPRTSVLLQVRRLNIDGYQKDVVFVLDEITNYSRGTEGQIEEFARRYPPSMIKSGLIVYGDATQTPSSVDGRVDWEVMRTHATLQAYQGQTKRKSSNPAVDARAAAAVSKFVNSVGRVGVAINPKCKLLIQDLLQTTWREDKPDLDRGSLAKGRNLTHWTDALTYFIEYEWPVLDRQMRVVGQGHSIR